MLGPCSPLRVIPDCNSTPSATKSVHTSVWEPFPSCLLVHISTARSFHIQILRSLTLLSCCVLSRGQPLSQRSCWILRPVLSVDCWMRVILEQGLHCNRKRGCVGLPQWNFHINPRGYEQARPVRRHLLASLLHPAWFGLLRDGVKERGMGNYTRRGSQANRERGCSGRFPVQDAAVLMFR